MGDMAGNVFEWTSTVYSRSKRVVRGGSWNLIALNSKVDYFGYGDTAAVSYKIGFRVCR